MLTLSLYFILGACIGILTSIAVCLSYDVKQKQKEVEEILEESKQEREEALEKARNLEEKIDEVFAMLKN